jgi:uncharacterized Tic20 family protein
MAIGAEAEQFGKVTDEQKLMAQMCHFSALAGIVACGMAMPLGPVLIWQAKKNLGPFVDANGKEALNFQLTYWPPTFLFMLLGAFWIDWFLVLPAILIIFAGTMAFLGGLKAGEGQMYRYPACLRLIR